MRFKSKDKPVNSTAKSSDEHCADKRSAHAAGKRTCVPIKCASTDTTAVNTMSRGMKRLRWRLRLYRSEDMKQV